MDSAMDEITKYCGAYLQDYQTCVTQNPNSWSLSCMNQRRRLTSCAEENVTSIKQVKVACRESLQVYDDCLSKHDNDPRPCLADLRSLYECTRKNSPQPLQVPGPPSATA